MAKKKTTRRKKSKKDFKIGFVGVGRMGANMARNLVDNGFTISAVSDANTHSARALAKELGCPAPKKLSEVTALADVVITVVTDDASMRSIFSVSGDSLLTEAKGTTFINCATISPATHVLVEKRAEKVGASSLEGCMASSITQARQGTLYLMCGGKRSVFNKVKPILDALSVSLRYIGTAGQAAQVKALVNMVMNINTAGLAEGLGLGKSLGLDLKTLMSVFSQTGANSRVLETDGEDMVIRDHECYFSADHAAKDSGIALKLATQQGLNLPLATATKAQFEKMKKLGIGDLDKSGIAELTFPGRKGDKGSKKK
ncbi:MAG TPA: NAD(P)-dependent oxidoreductase [Candidatus Handelsmanbacteria bacterium]|nr:NAD(P)-dependent oxidoreductase [Candidatus Handelsmanbacteria bacterium]